MSINNVLAVVSGDVIPVKMRIAPCYLCRCDVRSIHQEAGGGLAIAVKELINA